MPAWSSLAGPAEFDSALLLPYNDPYLCLVRRAPQFPHAPPHRLSIGGSLFESTILIGESFG